MSDDRINLIGMRFLGRHGVHVTEQVETQPFEVDVTLIADLSAGARSDDLADTIDYGVVFAVVRDAVEGPSYRLIEALAGRIVDQLLGATRAAAVEVRVRKPQAPLPGAFKTVEVVLRRTRP